MKYLLKYYKSIIFFYAIKYGIKKVEMIKLNLCGGSLRIPSYFNVDLSMRADLTLDLEKRLLPFPSNSMDTVVCISSINYFTRERGQEIIADVYRILRPGGIARFGVQDLYKISQKYINRDQAFFSQKLSNGKDRFAGETMADKINSWFYGYKALGKGGKYFYDFETLALLFKKAGFSKIEQKKYGGSRITEVKDIDNREDQMFFLEAIK